MGFAPGRPGRYLIAAVIAPLVVALGAMIGSYSGLNAGTCYDIAWTAAGLSATIGTVAARQRAAPENRRRWTLWALAAGCWLFGQLIWNVYGVLGFSQDPN